MIKIYTDSNLAISELEQINIAYRQLYNLSNDDVFSILINHCIENKKALDLSRMDIINTLKSVCLFIDDDWLSINVVSELPKDWTWLFIERPVRITIPLEIQAKALQSAVLVTNDKFMYLGQLINVIYPTISEFIVIDNSNVYIYVNYIDTPGSSQNLQILQMFEEIKIENL